MFRISCNSMAARSCLSRSRISCNSTAADGFSEDLRMNETSESETKRISAISTAKRKNSCVGSDWELESQPSIKVSKLFLGSEVAATAAAKETRKTMMTADQTHAATVQVLLASL